MLYDKLGAFRFPEAGSKHGLVGDEVCWPR